MKVKAATLVLAACLAGAQAGYCQAPAQAQPQVSQEGEESALRLVERGEELLKLGDEERGVAMLETVLDQFAESRTKYKVHLILGRYFTEAQKYADAIRHLRGLTPLGADEAASKEEQDWFVESLYLTGVANFHMRQYGAAFTVLRRVTRQYPNTMWANQAYYYIGMAHFALQNWKGAIEALSLVGTFVDPDSPMSERMEGGRRFYIKVSDPDIAILTQMGRDIVAEISTKGGDREVVACVPLSGSSVDTVIGSIPTAAGVAAPEDGTLQLRGGDEITVRYIDEADIGGKKNVIRETKVQVVSSGALQFTYGSFEEPAPSVYIGQPVFVLLEDMDLSKSDQPDTVTVTVKSRYKPEPEDESAFRAVSVEELLSTTGEEYATRDELTITLTELGEGPAVRTGRFGGQFDTAPFVEGATPDNNDDTLVCAVGDQVQVTYMDERHIAGDELRQVTAAVEVAGEVDGRPMATQNVVNDALIKARKDLVEATAYLELTRIFQSMGLKAKAKEKAQEGLNRVDSVILTRTPIPSRLKEEAFKTKWELYAEIEEYGSAIAACSAFSTLFPNSPYAEEALMRIGVAQIEQGDPRSGITTLRAVVAMPQSPARAEAQYRIAEALLAQAVEADATGVSQGGRSAGATLRSQAMQEFKKCSDQFPDSQFAGRSLSRLVDYYDETGDFGIAEDMLSQVFQDFPDATFLDEMLLKWMMLCSKTGNFAKAVEKGNQLIFDYPNSDYSEQARKLLPRLESRAKRQKK